MKGVWGVVITYLQVFWIVLPLFLCSPHNPHVLEGTEFTQSRSKCPKPAFISLSKPAEFLKPTVKHGNRLSGSDGRLHTGQEAGLPFPHFAKLSDSTPFLFLLFRSHDGCWAECESKSKWGFCWIQVKRVRKEAQRLLKTSSLSPARESKYLLLQGSLEHHLCNTETGEEQSKSQAHRLKEATWDFAICACLRFPFHGFLLNHHLKSKQFSWKMVYKMGFYPQMTHSTNEWEWGGLKSRGERLRHSSQNPHQMLCCSYEFI